MMIYDDKILIILGIIIVIGSVFQEGNTYYLQLCLHVYMSVYMNLCVSYKEYSILYNKYISHKH